MTVVIGPLGAAGTEPSFDLATRVFAGESTLHRALGIGPEEYRAYLRPGFAGVVAQGLSVAATDGRTGDLLGCLLVVEYRSGREGGPVPPRLAPLAALMADLRARYDRLRDPAPGRTILVDMAAIDGAARGGGLYRRMRAAAGATARARGYDRVIGEASSAATQHVLLHHLRHRRMAEIAFRDFVFEGDRPFASIADPPSLILAEGTL